MTVNAVICHLCLKLNENKRNFSKFTGDYDAKSYQADSITLLIYKLSCDLIGE